jgi:hypothetical protein
MSDLWWEGLREVGNKVWMTKFGRERPDVDSCTMF